VDLKLLLKRGALLAAANWPIVAFQFGARTAFQVLLVIPLAGAAILVALLLGGDLARLLRGDTRERFAAITNALASEPVALAVFVAVFGLVLLAGSALMFLVKGGTVTVLHAANDRAGRVELEPITAESMHPAAQFTLPRFTEGCARLFKRYMALGLMLMLVYVLTAAAYLALAVVAYRAAAAPALLVAWTAVATVAAGVLVVWITVVNLIYLLLQIAMAVEDIGTAAAARAVWRFVRAEYRELGGVFLVTLAMVVAATVASALAWSGVGLVAFVPLVGLAVIPLQLAALLVRGLVFEYIGLTALAAYLTLYRRHLPGALGVRDGQMSASSGLPLFRPTGTRAGLTSEAHIHRHGVSSVAGSSGERVTWGEPHSAAAPEAR
jgi:hypothetical protein